MIDSDTHRPRTSERPAFSIVVGGPLYQLFHKTRLLSPPLELVHRRAIVVPLLLWLPLLGLSMAEGTAWGGVRIPFLLDLEVHVKFLLALPLLIMAELLVHRRLAPLVENFVSRGIVQAEDEPRFREYVASAAKWSRSIVAELVLLVLVLTVGHLIWRERAVMGGNTWYASHSGSEIALTAAGYAYGFFSAPISQLFLLRWYYRIAIWARFLWQVSRLDLRLVPTHPDRAGGLGFLATAANAFGILLLAQGTMLAGMIAERVFFDGARLDSFRYEIGGAIVLMLTVVLGPLCVFVLHLARSKRVGLAEYGRLSSRYVREFDRKWVRGEAPPGETLMGSSDIQSLADLSNSFAVVREMHLVPFGTRQIVHLAFLTAAPVLPLVLTLIPLEELLRRIIGALF